MINIHTNIDENIGGMRCPSEEQQLLDLHALIDYGLVVSLTEHPLSFDLTEISKKVKIIHIPVTGKPPKARFVPQISDLSFYRRFFSAQNATNGNISQ
jgi:hypothetical protein